MLKSIIGGVLIAVGVLITAGFFVNAGKGAIDGGDIAAFLLVGVVPIVGGGLLIRSHVVGTRKALLEKQQALQTRQEQQIIRLAQQTGGRLSIPDIVAGTSLSTAEADHVMGEMVQKGYVDMQVTESGVIMYEFYEIAHRNTREA